MPRNYLKQLAQLVVAGAIIVTLSGCMHALMMGGHGDEMNSDATIDKRIVENNVSVAAVIPSMKANEENIVTITLQHAESHKPLTGATVTYHWMAKMGAAHQHSTSAMQDSTMLNGSATEAGDGKYTFTLSHLTEGNYHLSMMVLADSTSKPISWEVERTIPMQHSMSMGMMGMGSSSTTWIIGGAVMVAMILVMWGIR